MNMNLFETGAWLFVCTDPGLSPHLQHKEAPSWVTDGFPSFVYSGNVKRPGCFSLFWVIFYITCSHNERMYKKKSERERVVDREKAEIGLESETGTVQRASELE